MKLSEGWKRLFIVLSAVYWVIALWASVTEAFNGNGPTQSPWGFLLINLGASVLTYAAVAGMVANLALKSGPGFQPGRRRAFVRDGPAWISSSWRGYGHQEEGPRRDQDCAVHHSPPAAMGSMADLMAPERVLRSLCSCIGETSKWPSRAFSAPLRATGPIEWLTLSRLP